jgi:hypothetical protein
MNPPDTETKAEELVGTNIPEFFAAVREAVSLAHGYYWKPMTIWRSRSNKRRFVVVRKDYVNVDKTEWERITTITPHGGFSR